jgi:3-oxoacyl-[acyl-carrier protein] reductase
MMVKTTVDRYQNIDILFNNAGIAMIPIPIEEVKEEYWDKIMRVNLKGVFLCMKYVIPVMKRQGHSGVIINTASAQGVRPSPGRSAYCAAKAAVIQLTKAVALELAGDNIRVNCVNPIATDTPMLPKFIDESGLTAEKWEETKKSLIAAVPLGRIATPEDLARAALFLASDDSKFLTGIGLDIDGGRLI